jgi:hypothetical protein
MKITSIKQQVKNPERVSIFVDDQYAFSLSLDELVREKLKNNQEIDQAELKKLKKLSEDGKGRLYNKITVTVNNGGKTVRLKLSLDFVDVSVNDPRQDSVPTNGPMK